MTRYLFLIAIFILAVGTASADYVLIKINVNQMNFFPPSMPLPSAQPMGQMGGAGAVGTPPMPNPMGGGAGALGVPPGAAAGNSGFIGGAGFLGDVPPGAAAGNFGFMGGAGVLGGVPKGQPPAGTGGAGGQIPEPPNPQPGVSGMPVDPAPKWLYAWIEIKNRPEQVGIIPNNMGVIAKLEHKWSKKHWIPLSPLYPYVHSYAKAESFQTGFDRDFKKEKAEKVKNVENFLHLARKALERGRLDRMHLAMKEAENADPRHLNVKMYVKVTKDLAKKSQKDSKLPDDEDPTHQDLIRELRTDFSYRPRISEQRHFGVYANIALSDKYADAALDRRLKIMEDTLATFYYWFALQKVGPRQTLLPPPAMPRYRLMGIMVNTKEEFHTRNQQWGMVPRIGDAFTPRRDNVIVMATRARALDPVFQDFDTTLLPAKIEDANTRLRPHLEPYGVKPFTRDDLLSGKATDPRAAGQVAIYIGAAQTAVLLGKTIEDQAERATLTNAVIRQLLTASGAFPRNVPVPDWMLEGLAGFFETPAEALYPTIGQPSWTHFISFKHMCMNQKKEPAEVLYNVVTDRYFQNARKLSADLLENPRNNELRNAEREAWELARCTSWAFVYYLAQNGKLDKLFTYGKELDKLPRDLDLSEGITQRCFAKAFEMTDPKDPRRIAPLPLANEAATWFRLMQEATLSIADVQNYLMEERVKRDTPNGTGDTPNPK